MMERIIVCIPPNPRKVGNIVVIHGPLDEPLYIWAQYTPTVSPTKGHVPLCVEYVI